MIQYFIGLLVGIGVGIAIGLFIARGKRFSELTAKEKRLSTIYISIGGIILLAGISVLINMVNT